MGQVVPLTPTMSSRKAMVLDFVTAYIGAHNGVAPVYSEIAAAVGASKERVKQLILALEREGRLYRAPGRTRRLALPVRVEAAKRELRELGWRIDDDVHAITAAALPFTFETLPMIPGPRDTASGGGGSGGDGAVDG